MRGLNGLVPVCLNGSSIGLCEKRETEADMALIKQLLKQFLCDKRAATAIEYAMIGALISIAIIAGARAIGLAIQTKFYGPIASNLS